MENEIDIEVVWEKGRIIDGFDPTLARQDSCGAWMLKSDYGNRDSKFGWEVDHIYPESLGGDNRSENLRPMQWENNVSKGNDYPSYNAVTRANEGVNMDCESQFTVNDETQKILKEIYGI